MGDFFTECRERVSSEDAARLYGFAPNRAGYICCPFHGEKTPSLKLYAGDRGWYCYGCHDGGDVIDFTSKLFGLGRLDAVRKLNDDFSLGLPLDHRQTREERVEAEQRRHEAEVRRQFEDWREETLDKLCAALRVGNTALKRSPDTWTHGETEAVRWAAVLEHWVDELETGDLAAQMDLFRDRKGVERRCRTILGSMSTRSKLA